KLATPKGDTKAPPTDQIYGTLPAVPPGGNLYLTGTGNGGTPVGPGWQLQESQAAGEVTTVTGGQLAFKNYQGWAFNKQPGVLGQGSTLFVPGDRQVGSVLNSFDANTVYACDVEVAVSNGMLQYSNAPFNQPGVFGLKNCTALPPSCTDGIKNQD